MNFWTSDGTVDINNFNNYADAVVNEIHDIIYDLLKNKANTVELRKALLDIDSFSSIYDQYNYNQEYKPFIYYGLRKYSVLTNFYLPEIQTNNQVDAISPFEAATNVILEIDDLGFKNITKNRGFDLLVHLTAIDTAHKYIIEKTAQDINITEKTDLNIIIDELIKDDKNLFVKYKDIYIKYFQFLTQNRIELFNNIYKTNPEGFVKFLNYVFEAEFFKEDVYFLRKDNKLYVINERGIQKEINDEFVKVNINLLPENIYIPSPYFYVYLNLNAELFAILDRLLFTFIDDNNKYPIVINAITYNLTPQEILQVFILTVYKNIIEILYGIKPVFRKLNNIDTTIIDLYNSIKNSNEGDIDNCFNVFNDCILTKLCSEDINNNTYFAGKFNREIAGIIQIIINSSSDTLIDIYNLATMDDVKNIAIYLVSLFNYLCEEDINITYSNKYSKKTIQRLATYLVDLPYRMILYLIIQKINFHKDHFIYSSNKQILKLILEIKDYYYDLIFNLNDYEKKYCNNLLITKKYKNITCLLPKNININNFTCLSNIYDFTIINNNNSNDTQCSRNNTQHIANFIQVNKNFNNIFANCLSNVYSMINNNNINNVSCNKNNNHILSTTQLNKYLNNIDINCISKNFVNLESNYNLKLININNNFGLNSKNFKTNKSLIYYSNVTYENNICDLNYTLNITNNNIITYNINTLIDTTFSSAQKYTIKAKGISQFCNLCTINNIFLNITYPNDCNVMHSISNKKSNIKLYTKNNKNTI